jgi:hypothetical protein
VSVLHSPQNPCLFSKPQTLICERLAASRRPAFVRGRRLALYSLFIPKLPDFWRFPSSKVRSFPAPPEGASCSSSKRRNGSVALVVHLNNQPVSLLSGTPLDQSSMNQLMFRMRHRYPRQTYAAAVA